MSITTQLQQLLRTLLPDKGFKTAGHHRDAIIAGVEEAKTYTDEKVSEVNGYTDQEVLELKTYTDTELGTTVKKTGDETIEGVKTFTSSPVVPDATLPQHPVTLNQGVVKTELDIYNVTIKIPNANYYTLQTAIAAVPLSVRKKGLNITFETSDKVWVDYKFIGESTSVWTSLTRWDKLPATTDDCNFPCFVRNQADVSVSLNLDYKPGYKRKLKYQAFKGLKLLGFDTTKRYMLNLLWVDSYSESHYYRIRINQFNGSAWVSYFDTGTKTKTELGIIDNKIYNWDQTIGNLRIIAQIDFIGLTVNDGSIQNEGEPDLIINPKCIYDQDTSIAANVGFKTLRLNGQNTSPFVINNITGVKPYFNSRRKPTFAFIWEDLNPTDALVFSVFKEYGFIPSFALMSNNLNDTNAPEYQGYYMNGCTILAHSVSHPAMSNPASITYEEVDNQMKTSKKIIESYGMRVSGWVTPQSSLDISFFPLMVKNFGYGFTGLNGGLFNSTVDPLKMSRYGIESAMANHDYTTIINRIDTAITNNELVVFYGHKLPSTYLNSDTTPYVTEDDLRFLLDYLKMKVENNLCQVLSCDEAIHQYYKQPFI